MTQHIDAVENARLVDKTHMGAVTLKVADLDNMSKYYTQALPLKVLDQQGSSAIIGRGSTPVVILQHAPELQHASRRAAGLFHTAIVFETETAQLLCTQWQSTPRIRLREARITSSAKRSTSMTPKVTVLSCTGTETEASGAGSTARSRWTASSWTPTTICANI